MSERQYRRDSSGKFVAGALLSGSAAAAVAAGGARATGEARIGAREAELRAKWNIADTGQRVAGFNEQQFGYKSDRREHWQGLKNDFDSKLNAIPEERKALRRSTGKGFIAAGALGAAGLGVAAHEKFGKADGVPPRPRKPKEPEKSHALTGLGTYAGVHAGFAAHNRFGASTTNAVHGLRIKESAGRAMRAQRKFQAYKSTESGVAQPKANLKGKWGNLSGLEDLSPRAKKVVTTGQRAAKIGQGIRGTHNAVAAGTVVGAAVAGGLLGARGDKNTHAKNQAHHQKSLARYEQRKAKYDAAVAKVMVPRPRGGDGGFRYNGGNIQGVGSQTHRLGDRAVGALTHWSKDADSQGALLGRGLENVKAMGSEGKKIKVRTIGQAPVKPGPLKPVTHNTKVPQAADYPGGGYLRKSFPIPKHGLTPNRLKPMTEFKPKGEGSTADQLKRAGDKIKRGKFMTQPRDPERHLGAW